MAEAADDPEHTSQAASNAILAVIAANDAVCLFLGQRKPLGASHTEAGRVLQDVCTGTTWEEAAAPQSRRLVALVRQKGAIQYEGKLLGQNECRRIMLQAARFIEWTEQVLPPGGD